VVKFTGIILIMLAGISCGFSMSSKFKRHIATLELLNDMFTETIMLMNFSAVTYPELILHLKESTLCGGLKFLDIDTGSPEIREKVLEAVRANKDGLDTQESEKLFGFFKQFGTCDLDGQIAMAKKYMAYFSDRLNTLRAESVQKCRLYNSLGALGGAFLAVILV